jgi:hypothetical protein
MDHIMNRNHVGSIPEPIEEIRFQVSRVEQIEAAAPNSGLACGAIYPIHQPPSSGHPLNRREQRDFSVRFPAKEFIVRE